MTASFRNFSSCGLSSESGLPEKAPLRHRNQPLSPREDSALNFACDRYDSFIRTTDPKHDAIVNEFFARVNEKGATPFPLSGPCPALSTELTLCSFAEGDIYKKDYSGHYCVGCEAYLGDDEMETIDGVENCCSIHRKCATRPPPRSTAPRVASAGRAWPVRGQAKYFIFLCISLGLCCTDRPSCGGRRTTSSALASTRQRLRRCPPPATAFILTQFRFSWTIASSARACSCTRAERFWPGARFLRLMGRPHQLHALHVT